MNMIDLFILVFVIVVLVFLGVLISLRDAMESKKEEGRSFLGILWALRMSHPFRAWFLMIAWFLMAFVAVGATIFNAHR